MGGCHRDAQLQRATEAEAANAEKASDGQTDEDFVAPPERRKNRQEEGRLGTYVVSALENIYQSDGAPDDAPYVFDVHNDRPGNEYENVDLIAVHWRTATNVELIAVEVKLDFTARLVQQARNYARFADRVWLAVPVQAGAADASGALRELDPLLFEHVVDAGLGILACRRRPGKSYEVLPVHWPRRQQPGAVEREGFIERYRADFEEAGAAAPRASHHYPRFGWGALAARTWSGARAHRAPEQPPTPTAPPPFAATRRRR